MLYTGGGTALMMGIDVGGLCRFHIRKLKEDPSGFTVLSKIGNGLIC